MKRVVLLLLPLLFYVEQCKAAEAQSTKERMIEAIVHVKSLENAKQLVALIDDQGHTNWQAQIVLPEKSSIDETALGDYFKELNLSSKVTVVQHNQVKKNPAIQHTCTINPNDDLDPTYFTWVVKNSHQFRARP